MRRGDLAIGAIIGLVVIGAAGIFFFKSGSGKSDLVALEKFDAARKPPNTKTNPPPELTSSPKPRNVTIPPTSPPSEALRPKADPTPPAGMTQNTQSGTREPMAPPTDAKPPPKTEMPKKEPIVSSEPPPKPIVPEPIRTEPPPVKANSEPPHTSQPPLVQSTLPQITPIKLPVTHTVESDDTLSGIAQRYYNDPTLTSLIMKANPELKDPNRIFAGMKLVIPDRSNAATRPAAARPREAETTKPKPHEPALTATPPGTYRVQSKDTLISIAKRFYGDSRRWKEIYALNRSVIGPDPERLKLGDVLKLPPSTRPAASQPKR